LIWNGIVLPISFRIGRRKAFRCGLKNIPQSRSLPGIVADYMPMAQIKALHSQSKWRTGFIWC
jgi:hypothetical protein